MKSASAALSVSSERETLADLSRVSRVLAGFWLSWQHSITREDYDIILRPLRDKMLDTGPLSFREESIVRDLIRDWFLHEWAPIWVDYAGMRQTALEIRSCQNDRGENLLHAAGDNANTSSCPDHRADSRYAACRMSALACADVLEIPVQPVLNIVNAAAWQTSDFGEITDSWRDAATEMLRLCCKAAQSFASGPRRPL